jgi:hypothetical protein
MNIINLTSHEVILANGMLHITFPPSGTVVRVDSQSEKKLVDCEISKEVKLKLPIFIAGGSKVSNLPPPQEGVYYIVSNYVAQIARREDLIAPVTDNTAERDSNGNVLSVKGFQSYYEKSVVGV